MAAVCLLPTRSQQLQSAFDAAAGHYRSNVIVFATMLP
jgi:hypothetical protein